MAVYWIDPFIPAAVDYGTDRLGAGTDTTNYNTTSSRNGSYANPFRVDDWESNDTNATSVNGVTIDSGSEVRMKGKTMNDMSDAISDVYASSFSTMTPINSQGQTNLNNAYASGTSAWIYLHGSNIDAMYPSGVDTFPIMGYANIGTGTISMNTSTSELSQLGDFTGLFPAVRAAGFNSTGNPFCTARAMKTGYLTSYHALSNGDKYRWFSTNNRINKVSAGWTSETQQNGYSIVTLQQSDAYERQYWGYGAGNLHLDLGRLWLRCAGRLLRWASYPSRTGVTHEFGALHMSDYAVLPVPQTNVNVVVRLSMWWGNPATDNNNTSLQVNLYLGRNGVRHSGDGTSGQTLKMGSQYKSDYNHTYQGTQNGFIYKQNRGAETVEFLNGSSYIGINTDGSVTGNTNQAPLTTNNPSYTDSNHTYPATLYRAGSSGHWLSGVTLDANPKQGGNFNFNSATAQLNGALSLTVSNWWQKEALLMNTTYGMMPVRTVGRLLCSSQNYKTTANTLASGTNISIGASNTMFPAVFACETNDYDNKPVTVVPSASASSRACLVYNETIGGNEVVIMNGGTVDAYYTYAIEVQVPTTFDPAGASGVNDARVKLTLSRSSNLANTTAVYYYYRSNTTYTALTNSISASSISSDSANPTTHVQNLSIPESGLRKINSVIAYIRFSPTTASDLLRIHDVFVEVY